MIKKNNISNIYKLTPMQENIFCHYLSNPDTLSYFEQMVFHIKYGFDINRIKICFLEITKKYDVLRTVFLQNKEDFIQVVQKETEPDFIQIVAQDFESVEELIDFYKEKDRGKRFNLGQDSLIRLTVVHVSDEEFLFLWSFHHIILDGWSAGNLMKDFFRIYFAEGTSNSKEVAPFRTYIKWLRENSREKSSDYWMNYLDGFSGELSFSNQKEETYGIYREECYEAVIGDRLYQNMKAAIGSHSITTSQFLSAIWGILLNKYSNTEDAVFGKVVSGRNANINEIHSMVGLLINTLPVRIRYGAKERIIDLLLRTRIESLEGLDYLNISLADIQSKIKQTVLNHILVFENYPVEDVISEVKEQGGGSGFELLKSEVNEQINYDLCVNITEKESLTIRYNYNGIAFKEDFIQKLHRRFRFLIEQAVADLEGHVASLQLITEEETEQIYREFNHTKAEYRKDRTVLDLLKDKVEATPLKTALYYDGKAMSYEELGRLSDAAAHCLSQHGVVKNDCVVLMMDRSFDMMISMFGILKVGGVYVPLSPEYPRSRRDYILQDCKAKLLITDEIYLSELEEFGGTLLCPNDFYSSSHQGLEKFNIKSTPRDRMYIIYTSGSTGGAKGVVINYEGVTNRLVWMSKHFNFTADDVFLQKTAITFDVSIHELFIWTVDGGALALLAQGEEKNPHRMIEVMKQYEVTCVHFVPSMFGIFQEILFQDRKRIQDLSALKYIVTSGEELLFHHVNNHYELFGSDTSLRLTNQYGPTEATVDVTYYDCDNEENKTIPIGFPIDNVHMYITNKEEYLQPVGIPGELCIAGICLAEGYWNNRELTEEKFITPMHIEESRLYKTGDLACWLPDGSIQFMGRIDRQVKIRGFRIELSEIENCLLDTSLFKNVSVLAKQSSEHVNELYVFYSEKETESEQKRKEQIMNRLREKLPEYMLPSYIIRVEEFPFLASGKIDNKALSAMDIEKAAEEELVLLPEFEHGIRKIWAELLHIEESNINMDTNFFYTGGNSLTSIKLLGRIGADYRVKLTYREFFEHGMLRDFVALIKERQPIPYLEIEAAIQKERYAVTPSQKWFYVFQQLHRDSSAYNVTSIYRFKNGIKKEEFQKALNGLVKSHEILRTVYEFDNEVYQIVKEEFSVPIELTDGGNKEEAFVQEWVGSFIRPFDINAGPVLRAGILKNIGKDDIIIIDVHHIAVDVISLHQLTEELLFRYMGKTYEPSTIQFKDYTEWLGKEEQVKDYNRQRAYWEKEIAGIIDGGKLPVDKKRPDIFNYKGKHVSFTLPKSCYDEIRQYISEDKTTLFNFLLTSFFILIRKLTNSSELVAGIPVVCKDRKELTRVVGNFLNVLPIKLNLSDDANFTELLKACTDKVNRAIENQLYSFEDIELGRNAQRDTSVSSFLSLFFSMRDRSDFQTMELSAEPVMHHNETTKYELSFYGVEHREHIEFTVEYYSEIFREETIHRFVEYYKNTITEVLRDREQKLSDLIIIDENERCMQLEAFNNTQIDWVEPCCTHTLFERQVKETPSACAVEYENEQMTYFELNRRANQLAEAIKETDNRQGRIVGILMERSVELLISILAVMKSGNVFLPMDSSYPTERLRYMAENSQLQLLLVKKEQEELSEFRQLNIMEQKPTGTNLPNPTCECTLDFPSYLLYTSGSTGNPKGVVLKHLGLFNFMKSMKQSLDLSDCCSVLALTTITFDISLLELLLPLTMGMKVVIAADSVLRDPHLINRCILEHKIDVVQAVPSRIRLMSQSDLFQKSMEQLKYLLVGGEELKREMLELIHSVTSAKVFNMYGPTETTIWSTIKELRPGDEITLGKPIQNTKIYILDSFLNPVPIGTEGELYIGGDGVAIGYINNQELTEQSFLQNPYVPDEKIYRTRDYGTFTQDGEIRFYGRKDQQVKVGGFRIELEEIEAALMRHKQIEDAVVEVMEDLEGTQVICLYYIGEEEIPQMELKKYLLEYLPNYMLPKYIKRLLKFPTTLNNKLDRKQLPRPYEMESNIHYYSFVKPRNDLEIVVARIWCETLNLKEISVQDDFFYSGGNSLLVIKLEALLQREGFMVTPDDIYKNSTIERLAEFISGDENSSKVSHMHREGTEESKGIEEQSDQHRFDLDGIKPFNGIFYRSCFYNSLFPVLNYYEHSMLPIIFNEIMVYQMEDKQDASLFGMDYIPQKQLEQILEDISIGYDSISVCNDVVRNIIDGINRKHPVILWVDSYYSENRTDLYRKEHLAHSILITGYDEVEQIFYIIDHRFKENLTFEKQTISFKSLTESYQGFVERYKNENSFKFDTYYEFYSHGVSRETDGREVLPKFSSFLDSHEKEIREQKNTLFLIKDRVLQCTVDEPTLKGSLTELIESLNEIIIAKTIDSYRFSLIAKENKVSLLANELLIEWNSVRRVILRYLYTDTFQIKSISKLDDMFVNIYELEEEFEKAILSDNFHHIIKEK